MCRNILLPLPAPLLVHANRVRPSMRPAGRIDDPQGARKFLFLSGTESRTARASALGCWPQPSEVRSGSPCEGCFFGLRSPDLSSSYARP